MRGRGFDLHSGRHVESLSKTYLLPKVLVIPRKQWLRSNITKKLFTRTIRIKSTRHITTSQNTFLKRKVAIGTASAAEHKAVFTGEYPFLCSNMVEIWNFEYYLYKKKNTSKSVFKTNIALPQTKQIFCIKRMLTYNACIKLSKYCLKFV